MATQRQPDLGIGNFADEKIERLRRLKETAELARASHRSPSTKKILEQVIGGVNDSLRALRGWIKELSKGVQTDNLQILQTAQGLLNDLQKYIDAVQTALTSRLQHRTWFSWTKFERLLNQALLNVRDTISKLQNVLKVISVRSAKQVDRESRKRDVLSSASITQDSFSERLNRVATLQPDHLRASALQLLWENIPQWKYLDGKVGNAADPADGFIYDNERVAKAKSILEDLYTAWNDADTSGNYSPPPKLPEMAKIYLIAKGMKRKGLFEDFLESEFVDEDLPLEMKQLETTLKGQNIPYASSFFSEQYRAVPRTWEEGGHLEIDDEEPLPFVHEIDYREGSYGTVSRVRDSFSGDLYARKQQIIALEDKITAAAEKHLKDETERLRDLRHRHVVQFVKSYRRGKAYGILLKPAATSDLQKLLDRFYKDKFCGMEGCNDSVWLRPLFLTAFGCLSRGLAYIHGREIRHKDVKPANILYEKAWANNKTARFLWADFGLAYDFSETGDSRTRSTKLYSVRYAPPEILAANAKWRSKKRSSIATNLVEIAENDDEVLLAPAMNPQIKQEEMESHGRSADIFSLGCVFFELLARLMKEELPLKKINEDEKLTFSHNIAGLGTWAQQKQELATAAEFRALFPLATRMISRKPGDRPLVDDIVKTIATDRTLGDKYFCSSCTEELSKEFPRKAMGQSSRSAAVHSPPASPAQVTGPSSPRSSSAAALETMSSSIFQPKLKRMLTLSSIKGIQ